MVIGRTSIIQPLPLAYYERLQRIPGVKDVTFANWFGGVYQDEQNFFAQFAIDRRATCRCTRSSWWTRPVEEFLADRQGASWAQDGPALRLEGGGPHPARRHDLPGDLGVQPAGHLHGAAPRTTSTQFCSAGTTSMKGAGVVARAWSGGTPCASRTRTTRVRVSQAIDSFANSPWETRTQTEKAFAASFVKQMGNIEFLILTIGTVVFFTLLLVTGNTMAIAVRERIAELAVLKAVGYSDTMVLGLVLAESLVMAVVGGGLGLALAKAIHAPRRSHRRPAAVFYLAPAAQWSRHLPRASSSGSLSGLLPACGRDAAAAWWTACGGSDDGHPARLQLARASRRAGSAGGGARYRRHGGRFRGDAGAGPRLPGHAGVLGARPRTQSCGGRGPTAEMRASITSTAADHRGRARGGARAAAARWSAPRSW